MSNMEQVLVILGVWFGIVILRGVHDHVSTKDGYYPVSPLSRPLRLLICWATTALVILVVAGAGWFAEWLGQNGLNLMAGAVFALSLFVGAAICVGTIGCSFAITFVPPDEVEDFI